MGTSPSQMRKNILFTIASAMSRRKLQPSLQTGFAQRLVKIRKLRQMAQVQVAEVTGLTQRAISHYETGAGYPPAPTIVALAQALRVSADELLGRKKTKNQPQKMSPQMQRPWKKFQQVTKRPDKDQRAVIRPINSLARST